MNHQGVQLLTGQVPGCYITYSNEVLVTIINFTLISFKRFVNDALNTCQFFVNYQQSPGGRTHFLQWGSIRYAANAAFICLQASDLAGNEEQSKNFREYALGQMEYMLGSTGRSFVVGFGNNPPTQPHHASSSCPIDPNESCGWNNYNADSPNPHILYGALVGG